MVDVPPQLRAGTVECYWVDDTGLVEVSLRRYISEDCPERGDSPFSYCNESVDIGRSAAVRGDGRYLGSIPVSDFANDDRWPQQCSRCGRPFGPLSSVEDRVADGTGKLLAHTQVNQEGIYRAADGRGEWPQRRLPAGAMFDAFWLHDQPDTKPDYSKQGPDGLSLMVVLPYEGTDARGSMWNVDGFASGNGSNRLIYHAWARTGDPRVPGSVSATPSIVIPPYHGFLRNGTLVDA